MYQYTKGFRIGYLLHVRSNSDKNRFNNQPVTE